MKESTTVVDFIAKGSSPSEWKMVLVEEGPWVGPINVQLSRIQERLYGCIDAALDGQLAEKYPETKGKRVIVRLDCYNVPRIEVEEFFHRFSSGVFEQPDYRRAINCSDYVSDISLEIEFDHIH